MLLSVSVQCHLMSFHDHPCFEGLCILAPSCWSTSKKGRGWPTMEAWRSGGPWASAGTVGRGECQAGVRKQPEGQPEQGLQDPLGLPGLMVTSCVSLVVLGYHLPFFICALSCDRLESIASKACLAECPAPLCPCGTAQACGDMCHRRRVYQTPSPALGRDVFLSDAQHGVVPGSGGRGSHVVPPVWNHVVPSGVRAQQRCYC